MRSLWTLFVYASVGFVLLYLYRLDHLHVPELLRPGALAPCAAGLILGFGLETAGWRRLLALDGAVLSPGAAIAASGRSVLGKYIPGKLWMILGRAAWAARQLALPLSRLSLLTFNAQILALWAALALGLPGLVGVGGLRAWGPVWLALFGLFSLFLFSRVAHRRIEAWLDGRWPSIGARLPHVEARTALAVVPWFVGGWLAWGGGFVALAWAIVPDASLASTTAAAGTPASMVLIGLGFPLASALGMAAVVVPGGLGVREGVLTAYLVLAGMDIAWATALAVTSRLWFLAGELAWFVLGHGVGRDAT